MLSRGIFIYRSLFIVDKLHRSREFLPALTHTHTHNRRPHLSSRSTFSNWTLLKASFDIQQQKASLANISPTPMRPHDIPLSGVRKSCRRWFLRVFSLSRSIGTPEPVSKGLSGGRYEMGVGRWNGCEWVEKWWTPLCAASTWICIPPELPATILTSLSLTAVFSSTQLRSLFPRCRPLAPRRPASSRPRKAPAARGT